MPRRSNLSVVGVEAGLSVGQVGLYLNDKLRMDVVLSFSVSSVTSHRGEGGYTVYQ